MRIAEIYQSIQGEGRLTGTESVFVRASGCNLRCWFCDTPHASWSPEGTDFGVDEILEEVIRSGADHVVLTGGEPMLFAELIPLCDALHHANKHITIETAGTLHLPLRCDLMSISPKLVGSAPAESEHPKWHARHLKTMHRPEVISQLIEEHEYQIKFVVDREEDLSDIENYLDWFPLIDREKVMLMPQGISVAELEPRNQWLQRYCLANGLTFCARKQIEWFGCARGT